MTNDEKLSLMDDVEKLSLIADGVYKICRSLIYIVDTEGCTYGQDESVKMAEAYAVAYEADHPELNADSKIVGQAFDPD